ncbi:hypothetical protein Hbl1158_07115 [Halobaculum sp. CBA1158]|uniref:hypothetical protein n=1 Tax=Halobaculum sp. CBA1158 TaxID=2904243 RepID=UPI001F2C6D41|nr:hypothetical protein [Halobaculum sp. CBA1158]UIP01109.1 hypothetical protein Hbl1158_07115 [Halobaculum sp. CBA1158]
MPIATLYRLAGTGFTLATFPGLVVATSLQAAAADRCAVPPGRAGIEIGSGSDSDSGRGSGDAGPVTGRQGTDGGPAGEGSRSAARTDGGVAFRRPGPPSVSATAAADYRRAPTYTSVLAATALPPVAALLIATALFAASMLAVEFWTLAWWMLSWLGFAVAAHATPEPAASRALWDRSKETDSRLGGVGRPIAGVGRLLSASSVVRADALVAAALYYLVAAALFSGSPQLVPVAPALG